MLEMIGDFWTEAPKYDVLCVTTNGVVKKDGRLVMGAGIALDFRKRFPDLDLDLGDYVSRNGNHVFLKYWTHKVGQNCWVASFPTKHDFYYKSELPLIKRSAQELVRAIDAFCPASKVLLTRPGCGMGGLTWEQVKPIIGPILDERFMVISNG